MDAPAAPPAAAEETFALLEGLGLVLEERMKDIQC